MWGKFIAWKWKINLEDHIVFIVLFLRHIKHVQSGVTYIPECRQIHMYSENTLITKPSTH